MKKIPREKSSYILLLFVMILLPFLVSCDGIITDKHTIAISAGSGGSINPSGVITVDQGGSQTFTITANECYQIDDVLIDGVSVGPVDSYTLVSIKQDYTIHADFVPGPGVKNIDTGIKYLTIQSAIDAALAGETIVVCPGTYYEKIVFDGKDITVQSTDPSDPDIVAVTIIDGGGTDSVIWFLGGDTSTLQGFTVQNGDEVYGGGIYMHDSAPVIENNIITNNHATGLGGGIRVSQSSPTITNNTISYNNADAYGGGIYVDWNSELLPADPRPTGWGPIREDIPIGDPLIPADGEEYTIAGNKFVGNEHSDPSDYTQGAHVNYQ